MANTKKIEEGIEHTRLAEKSLKTSLLKWRPDFDEAADEYNKAATCFRNAKSFEQCKECLMKSADCHKQNRNLFYAAKALDQAISVCKELGDLREVASLADRAANMYMRHGSAETGAASLDKAAKVLEQTNPEDALKLYQQASEIALIQDSTRQAAEYLSKVARINVKLKNFEAAADAIRREIGIHQQNEAYQAMGRLAVALVLVQLGRGDVVAAEKAFKEWGNCCEAPEVQTIEMLLQAYDEEDADAARRALNNPFIKHMDVEYSILARDMALPEGMIVPQKANVRENAAASYVSPNSSTDQAANSGDTAAASGDTAAASGDTAAASGDAKQEAEDDDEDEGLC